jgi:DNA sulfur modification protein DndD
MNAGELGAELQIMDKGVSVTEARLKGSKENLDRAQKDYVQTNSEFAVVQSDLNKLAPKLEGIRGNEDYIREIAGKLKNAEGDLTSLRVHSERLVQQVELAGNDVASAQKKFDKATAGTADAEAIREKVEFLGKVISQAQSFNQQILESVRARLEMYVSEQYSRVKRGDFVTKITEDFEVQTLNKNGVPASLSEGEKMLKAYIFSIALREVVGLKFPLIVDTPFGRLGEENRQLITRTLRDLLKSGKDHQVMFMMHDGEYTPYTRDDFSDMAPFEGYLDWKEAESETSLGLGIDPSWLEFSAWKDWADRSGRK